MSLLTRYRTPSGSTQVLGEGHDLSKDGLFIASEKPESLGTLLEVEWEGRTGRTLRALARVAWIRIETRAGKPAGMGVEFVKTGPDGRPAVESVTPPGGASSPPPGSTPPNLSTEGHASAQEHASVEERASDTSSEEVKSEPPPIADGSIASDGTPAADSEDPNLPSSGATTTARPSFRAAKAALGELRDRISRARRSAPPSSEPTAASEVVDSDVAAPTSEPTASPADAAVAAEPTDAAMPRATAAEDVAGKIPPGPLSEPVIGATAEHRSDPPPDAGHASEVSAPEMSPSGGAASPADTLRESDSSATPNSDERPGIHADDSAPAPPPAAPDGAAGSTPPAAADDVSSAPPPANAAASGTESLTQGTDPETPPEGVDLADVLEPPTEGEPGIASADEPRGHAQTTEPGLTDAVVARMLDAAQTVQESFRPFALKGDVPTASFRWKPLVVRILSLAVLAGAVTFSWFHGARLLERILPPELLPVAEPAQERLPGRLAPAVPQSAPAPTETAPAAAPAVAADGAEYALDVRTVPPRASATVGTDTIITPGVISLGTFPQPVELRIEKLGYQPETTVIDRSGFAPAGGRMLRVVSLTLKTATAATTPPRDAPAPGAPEPPSAPPVPPTPAPAVTAVPGSSATAAPPGKPNTSKPAPTKPAPTKTTATKLAATKKAKEGAKAAAPATAPTPGVSPLQAAQACLARGDNACAVDALAGKARTPRELELLVETHRAMGNQVKAWEVMRTYLERFPDEKRADSYRRTLGQ